ncbi:hypothetical protein [Burkholderia pseudomallei]|uniref:hypothetical protein n=1 Tax=Burkholderia pseudomallei TaxID=28450 RepID=UPI0009B229D5|nr:hypothetical protein [Burkholderia pseudomallei]
MRPRARRVPARSPAARERASAARAGIRCAGARAGISARERRSPDRATRAGAAPPFPSERGAATRVRRARRAPPAFTRFLHPPANL